VRVDGAPPSIVIPSAIEGTCHGSIASAEAAVRAAALLSDDCTPASQLVVRTESAVSECGLRVRVDVTDAAGKTASAAATVRVDDAAPRVEIARELLNFRGEVLALLTPACFASVEAAEQAVLAATRATDGCSHGGALVPQVSSSGPPCSLNVTVSATDACGGASSDSVVVRVDDAPASVVSSTTVTRLQNVNHEMVDVGFAWSATDGCSGALEASVTVTSDEPTAEAPGAGQASKSPDAAVLSDPDGNVARVLLRAERSSQGDGRVYVIRVRVTDPCGHVATSTSTVTVPRNGNGPGGGAVDSGQFYDATQVN
jgi:hypothetical protein